MASRSPRWTKTPARALADALVRRYPGAWRERYEAEVLTLLDDSGVRWRDVGDLMTGLLMERARALIEPGDHPLGVSLALAAIHLSTPILAVLAGWGAGGLFGTLPAGVRIVAEFVVGPTYLIAALWVFASLMRSPQPSAYPPKLPAGWFALLLGALFVMAWAGARVMGFVGITLIFVRSNPVVGARWEPVQEATRELFSSRTRRNWAIMELERCRREREQGREAPLAAAQGEMARIEQQSREALEKLHSLGYRAALRRLHPGDSDPTTDVS